MSNISDRLMHAWDAFRDKSPDPPTHQNYGQVYGGRPDRVRVFYGNERSVVTAVYVRLAVDIGDVQFRHVRLDDQQRYLEDCKSGLNECLSLEANLDQTAQHLFRDIAMTLFDSGKGVACVVPVETSSKPTVDGGYDIRKLRVGTVVNWMPEHVRVDLYNEKTGLREEVTLPKKMVAIIENPFYAVMNEPSSTLQRLIRKLNILDTIDEEQGAGKLDMIIQLPYVIKTESRREQAEKRRKDIEFQLKSSKYGIAYTDGTERITQLNRPVENNLMKEIEWLQETLYSQLGISKKVMDGTASEEEMLNYNNRTIKPIVDAIATEFKRKFLTKTARTRGQSVEFYRDPFSLVPLGDIAEIADKFTRNEIITSNEIRQFIGMKPAKDVKADELRNSNMPVVDTELAPGEGSDIGGDSEVLDEVLDKMEQEIDNLLSQLDSEGGDPDEE